MAHALRHRGPDDEGEYAGPGIAFGFKRLSIVDLATGNQPHSNEDGDVVCVCNGEIYNHRALRTELEARGHRFRTACDVEVLVHLYEEHGPDLATRLDGQFAFALYDRCRHRLVLCRDHVGIAPLFHKQVDDRLLFGSEIKALLARGEVTRRVDLRGLDQVLTLPGLVSPTTMFEGISALPPGHLLLAEEGRTIVRAYWDLDYPQATPGEPDCDPRPYVDELDALLVASVRRRLDADVPVGLYVSGGLDSSLIAAIAHRFEPNRRFHTYSIAFPDALIDERDSQRRVAAMLGSAHHELDFHEQDIVGRLQQAIEAAEAPLKETYNTCSLALSALARDSGHKVVLTGEGADELFAGYVGYRLDAAGGRARGGADGLEALLEAEARAELFGDPDFFYERDYVAFRDVRAGLYSADVARALPSFDCTRRPLLDARRMAGRHRLHQRSYADVKLRLGDHLLADHGDRVGYANGVEARYPFLDREIVAFAERLPPSLLVREGTEKWLLRQVAARHLPPDLVQREKFSFVAPGAPLLLRQRIDWIDDQLSPARLRRQNYFDADAVQRLRDRHVSGGTTINATFDTDVLMLVLSFGLFLDAFGLEPFASSEPDLPGRR